MIPALAYGALALGSVYQFGKARDAHRYWSDYGRNTGVHVRYPYRSGKYDWMKDLSVGYALVPRLRY